MSIELRQLDEFNQEDCIRLKVTKEQFQYIDSNEKSIAVANEHSDVARPFVIYSDGIAVGFAMFAFEPDYEDPGDRYWLWRFMIDEQYQNRGLGREALKHIITYFNDNGATNIKLSTKKSNTGAILLYESFGFAPTGNMVGEEIEYELNW